MPTIQYISPVGGAVDAASSLAGGFTGQSNIQNRQALLEQELDIRRKREQALMQAMEIEQQTAEEERLRAAELREASAQGVQALGDINAADPTDPDEARFSDMVKRAHGMAERIARAGGDPKHYLDAVSDYETERRGEQRRVKDLEDFQRQRGSGLYATKDETGKALPPDQDPSTGILDEIENELSTPGGDAAAAQQKLHAYKVASYERERETRQRMSAVASLEKASADNTTMGLPNQALDDAIAGLNAGIVDPAEVYANLPHIKNNQVQIETPWGPAWVDYGEAQKLQQGFLQDARDRLRAQTQESQSRANYYDTGAPRNFAGGGSSRSQAGAIGEDDLYKGYLDQGDTPDVAMAKAKRIMAGGGADTPFEQSQQGGGIDPGLLAAVKAGTQGMDPNDPATREVVKRIKDAYGKTGGKAKTETPPATAPVENATEGAKAAPADPKYGGLVAVLDDIGKELPATREEYMAAMDALDKELGANTDRADRVLGVPILTRNTRNSGAKQQRSTQRTDERLKDARRELMRYGKERGFDKDPNAAPLKSSTRNPKPRAQRDEDDE